MNKFFSYPPVDEIYPVCVLDIYDVCHMADTLKIFLARAGIHVVFAPDSRVCSFFLALDCSLATALGTFRCRDIWVHDW